MQALIAVALFSTLSGEALGTLLGQHFVITAPYLVAVAWAAMLPALGLAAENLHEIGGRLRRLLFAGFVEAQHPDPRRRTVDLYGRVG